MIVLSAALAERKREAVIIHNEALNVQTSGVTQNRPMRKPGTLTPTGALILESVVKTHRKFDFPLI